MNLEQIKSNPQKKPEIFTMSYLVEYLQELKNILNRSFETLEYCVTKDVRINYHVLIYARNTSRYIERFGIDSYSQIYVNNAVSRIKNILDSDEYIYMNLKLELMDLYKNLKQYTNL